MTSATDRDALVAEARLRLERHGWPRLQASLLLVVSGATAFVASVALLTAGLHSMTLIAPDARSVGGVVRALAAR